MGLNYAVAGKIPLFPSCGYNSHQSSFWSIDQHHVHRYSAWSQTLLMDYQS